MKKIIIIIAVAVFIGIVPSISRASTVVNGITCATGGDANQDGVVNGTDYALIDNGFNQFSAGNIPNPTLIDGDFNGDGVVDVADYAIIDANYPYPDCPKLPAVATSTPVTYIFTQNPGFEGSGRSCILFYGPNNDIPSPCLTDFLKIQDLLK